MNTFLILIVAIMFGLFVQSTHAQMMGQTRTPSVDPTVIQQQSAEETEGKKLFEEYQNGQIPCQQLTEDNFEKIGEYTMSRMFAGNTAAHISMNERITSMHGATGEAQMHVQMGKNITGCSTDSRTDSMMRGGVGHMMGYGNYGMMNGGYSWVSAIVAIGWIALTVDLILAGIWLWQQIAKNKKK